MSAPYNQDRQADNLDFPGALSRRRLGTFLWVGLGAAAAGGGLWYGLNRLQGEPETHSLLAPLNEVKLENLEGKVSHLQDWMRPWTIINFWATWCPPCVAEMPLINRIYKENASKNIQIIGIAVDKPEPVSRFVQQNAIEFPILLAGFAGVALSQHFGNTIGALPYTVLVQNSSTIVARKAGEISEKELRSWLLNRS